MGTRRKKRKGKEMRGKGKERTKEERRGNEATKKGRKGDEMRRKGKGRNKEERK